MATRNVWPIALALLAIAGCQSNGRGPSRPLAMLPAAPLDETPRPKAVEAPKATPGNALSTAAAPFKKLGGEEESTYQFPIPPAPTATVPTPPKAELPPPPIMPLGPTPPALPPALPPAPPLPTEPVGPTLSPPVPVDVKPMLEAKPASLSPALAPPPTPPALKVQTNHPNTFDAAVKLRELFEKANRQYATMDSYTLRMKRREVVGGKVRPEELILAKFRREPFSLYLKWVGEEGKGREVCFVQGQYNGDVHTLLARGDMIFLGGTHFKCPPESPLVKSNCRYPITDAGLGPIIARFGRLVAALEKGDSSEGTAKILGNVKRPEFDEPVEGIVQNLPAKYDPLFPNGGQRVWYFDVKNGLPVLIITFDHQGKEVEYYCHDRVIAPANLDDDDFNPYRMWKTSAK